MRRDDAHYDELGIILTTLASLDVIGFMIDKECVLLIHFESSMAPMSVISDLPCVFPSHTVVVGAAYDLYGVYELLMRVMLSTLMLVED